MEIKPKKFDSMSQHSTPACIAFKIRCALAMCVVFFVFFGVFFPLTLFKHIYFICLPFSYNIIVQVKQIKKDTAHCYFDKRCLDKLPIVFGLYFRIQLVILIVKSTQTVIRPPAPPPQKKKLRYCQMLVGWWPVYNQAYTQG